MRTHHENFTYQSKLDDPYFYEDFNLKHDTESEDTRIWDEIVFENPNTDFEEWDFHPNELDQPSTFTYSTHLENLRTSINTLLKRSIKKPLS